MSTWEELLTACEQEYARLQESLTACEQELVGAKNALEVVAGIAEVREQERDEHYRKLCNYYASFGGCSDTAGEKFVAEKEALRERVGVLEGALRKVDIEIRYYETKYVLSTARKAIDAALATAPPAEPLTAPESPMNAVLDAASKAVQQWPEWMRRLGDLDAPPAETSVPVVRNTSTPEARDFWRKADETAAEVAQWPAWKRGGEAAETPAPTARNAVGMCPYCKHEGHGSVCGYDTCSCPGSKVARDASLDAPPTDVDMYEAEMDIAKLRAELAESNRRLDQAERANIVWQSKVSEANEEIARLKAEHTTSWESFTASRDMWGARNQELLDKNAATTAKLGRAVAALQLAYDQFIKTHIHGPRAHCGDCRVGEQMSAILADAENKAAGEAWADGKRFEELARALAKSARLSWREDKSRLVNGTAMVILKAFIVEVDARRGGGK